MKKNWYVIFAFIAIILVGFSYAINFYFVLDYSISNKSIHWAELGTYFGGVLTPILNFIAILLLIRSLDVQKVSNEKLELQIKATEKSEKVKSFEVTFFQMISSQKQYFESFSLNLSETRSVKSFQATEYIESLVIGLREQHSSDKKIKCVLEKLDKSDQLYSLLRSFFIVVKLVDKKLSCENGFTQEDRLEYIETLINFTDFNQIHLILICCQFLTDYYPVQYLRENDDFINVMNQLELSFDNY